MQYEIAWMFVGEKEQMILAVYFIVWGMHNAR